MKHFFLGVAVMAAATLPLANAGQAPSPPQAPAAHAAAPVSVDRHVKRCTVRVSHRAGNSLFAGSGTVVRMDGTHAWVLTCSHVAEGARGHGTCSVHTAGGKTLPAEWWYWNTSNKRDLALVKAKLPEDGDPGCEAASVAEDVRYDRGVKVIKSGYPGELGGRYHLGRGEVVGVTGYKTGFPDIKVLRTTAYSRPGDSGGGLFSAKDGKLIGVVWGGDKDAPAPYSCVTTLKDIRWFLARVEEREKATAEAEEGVSEGKTCPVRGGTCPCGCRDGDPCTCAAAAQKGKGR